MEELHEDIQRYLGLEELQVNIDFWTVSSCINCSNVYSVKPVEHDGRLQRSFGDLAKRRGPV